MNVIMIVILDRYNAIKILNIEVCGTCPSSVVTAKRSKDGGQQYSLSFLSLRTCAYKSLTFYGFYAR